MSTVLKSIGSNVDRAKINWFECGCLGYVLCCLILQWLEKLASPSQPIEWKQSRPCKARFPALGAVTSHWCTVFFKFVVIG